MIRPVKILMIEDSVTDAELICREVKRSGISFTEKLVDNRKDYIEALKTFVPDVILSDYALPEFDGKKALFLQQEMAPSVPFLLVTGSVNEETAVECMKAGADDYILKQNLTRLGEAIKAAMHKKQLLADKMEVEDVLRKSEARYRSLFENSAIPIFEEDYSRVKQFFNKLSAEGITDFRAHFDNHPEDVVNCASMIEIIDVNNESIRFFQAQDKQEIFTDMSTYFLDESWAIFKEQLIALAEGKSYFECEFPVSTFQWEHRDLILKLSVRPDSQHTLKHVFISFVDITDRKLAEAALKDSEEQFRTAYENASVGVCMTDLNGILLNVNNALCMIWGYSKDELAGRNFNEITLEEDKGIGMNLLRDLISGEIKHASFEKRYRNKNGNIVWASVSTGLVHSISQRKDYFVSYLQDITQRKEAELMLQKSAELYCTLTESMKDVVWILDPETLYFRYISPSVQKMAGYSTEEILALPMSALVLPEYREKLNNDMLKIIHDCESGKEVPGTFHTQIIPQPCKDGSVKWAEITCYAFRNEENGKLELRGVHRDVTAQRQAQDLLRKSEEKFRLLYEFAADPIQLLDENLLFLDCNTATLNILGIDSKSEFLNLQPWEISPQFQPDGRESDEKSKDFVKTAFSQGSYRFEWVHRRMNGELFTVDINLTKIPMEGKDLLLVHWRDITKRKQIEDALLKSEAKFRLLAENASDVIWTMDLDGKNTYVSPSIERLRGYTPEEALQQTAEESLTPESALIAKKFLANAIEKISSGERFENYRLILEQPCKDGTIVWVEATVSGIYDETGSFISFLGVSRNITDRRQTEIALSESEERYRLLIENQGEGVGIVDLDENFVFCNPAAEQMFDVPPGMLIQRNLKEFIKPEELKKLNQESSKRREGNKSTYELGIISSTGIAKQLLVTSTPYYDKTGKFSGTFGVFRDITARKKAEELLMEREFWLSESQRVGRIGSYSLNIVNDHWTSSAVMDEILGIEPNTHKTLQTWLNIVHPDHVEMMKEYFTNHVIGQKKHFNKEYKILRRTDGVERWVWGNGELTFNEAGEPVQMIGTIVDITDRKLAEEALIEAKERAEENDRLKTAFLNNISHEIRTPMNAIIGFSGFLNEPELSPDKRKYFTEIICNASNHLLSVITDIINIATVEAGQASLKKTRINLNQVVRNLFNQFELKARERNIRLEFSTPLPDNYTNIDTDETKLMQILSNLIGNALKFTKQGHVKFGYTCQDHHLEFYIEDTGIGIAPELHEEIFERFRQADSTIARQFGGTGLGLSISKAYVELLGGKIWVSSKAGEGATFYFTLPFEMGHNGHSHSKVADTNEFISFDSSKTILIAEDEDLNYLLLEQVLSEYDLKLIRVENGAEAFDFCKNHPEIDLVLMDVKMPVMDGYEATRMIKAVRPELPIIMQTAYSRESDRQKSFECGCDGYISKPIIISEFLGHLQKHLKITEIQKK